MTIAEQFASRYAVLNTDKNRDYDDPALIEFERDIYEATTTAIPVDPEDELCSDYIYVFEDGSGIDADEYNVLRPEAVSAVVKEAIQGASND